jgi:hypothetical protein
MLNIIKKTYVPACGRPLYCLGSAWTRCIFSLAPTIIFFFSLLLEFNASPFKISNQPLNFFLFHICSLSFWLFFLIIYKITNIFQFHPLSFFYFLKFDPHFFIAIYFVWNHFLDCFFTISSSIVFFLSDLILILLLLSFLLWQVF